MPQRVTQHVLEAVTTTTPATRVTQQVVEVLSATFPVTPARVTQQVVEVLLAPRPIGMRVTQQALEVLSGTLAVPALPRFPAPLAYGAQGGPGFHTDVVVLQAGQEQRNVNWLEALCRWDVGSINRSKAEIDVLVAFFHAATRGQDGLFLFRDFTDDTFDNALGVGDGTTRTFPLVKVYAVGPYSRERRITHPLAGSVSVALDGVLVDGWSLDDPGLLTFATAPDAGMVVSAAGTFEVVCRFAQDHLPVTRVAPNAYSCDQIEILEVRR